MDAVRFDCDVASATWHSWHQIPWSGAHQVVSRLQTRIAKAAKAGEWRKVRFLQGLLTRSTSARALAVRRVTENRGRKTPGVEPDALAQEDVKQVGVEFLTPEQIDEVDLPHVPGNPAA
jgi:RNA-directed DNA polymerase